MRVEKNLFLIELFQIQVCKSALSQEDVTPKNATNILLLADRHSLNELKKVNQDNKKIFTYILIFLNSKTQRVIAWILAEKEKYMADEDGETPRTADGNTQGMIYVLLPRLSQKYDEIK